MLAARGEYRLFTDFDQSTPLSDFEKFLPYIDDGYDVVIGSRALEGAKREKEPIHRHVMGMVFNVLVQMIAVPGIHDTQCGFKMFTAKATEELFPKLVVYGGHVRQDAFTGAFDVELLLLARRHKFSIAEVPVGWQHNATERVSPLKDSVRMFADIVKIRLADISQKYKK
jgi:dolichyl-phosphate beta-glucosyltransferase